MAHSHAEPRITEKKPARPERVRNEFRFVSHFLARTRALPAPAISVALPRERTLRCRAVTGQSSFSLPPTLALARSRSLGLRDRIENKRCHWPRRVHHRLAAVADADAAAAIAAVVAFSRTHARTQASTRMSQADQGTRNPASTAGSARAAVATLRAVYRGNNDADVDGDNGQQRRRSVHMCYRGENELHASSPETTHTLKSALRAAPRRVASSRSAMPYCVKVGLHQRIGLD